MAICAGRVLVVDDDPLVRRGAVRFLVDAGFHLELVLTSTIYIEAFFRRLTVARVQAPLSERGGHVRP